MKIPRQEEIDKLVEECFAIAKEHGFHDKPYSFDLRRCLIVSELMEAVEADRKGRHANIECFNETLDEACYESFEVIFEGYIKDTVEDELADAAIRIFDCAGNGDASLHTWGEPKDFGKVSLYEEYDFAEAVFDIVEDIVNYYLEDVLFDIFCLAHVMGFDLMEHIKLKMNYNRTRPRLHGKKY